MRSMGRDIAPNGDIGASIPYVIASAPTFTKSNGELRPSADALPSAPEPGETDCEAVETALCVAPAGTSAAWLTEFAWAAAPPALVFCCGGVNGVSCVAAAAEPAYPYIATASCAHISLYSASVAAIAGVFCPNRFVAISDVSWVRLAATSGGGTVAANAASYAGAAPRTWRAVCSA